MLTIEINGKYQYYNYWWSYWYAGEADKRKLFSSYREIEYFIGLKEFKPYLKIGDTTDFKKLRSNNRGF